MLSSVQMMLEGKPSVDVVLAVLNDPAGSDCMVMFLRAITAAAFMKRAETDQDFTPIMCHLVDEDRSAEALVLHSCSCSVLPASTTNTPIVCHQTSSGV